jgi:indolepyruvate ferredoxin oxidoreductase alpha subunit
MSHPLPYEHIRSFAEKFDRCIVVEEGAPYLATQLRAEGIEVKDKHEDFRLGELNVQRVRSILDGGPEETQESPAGKAPELCPGCPHRKTFSVLSDLDCTVTGDIGCYTLGVLPPYEAMDTCLCMGASIGVGLGLRHVLPPEQARRVVSVIGDSTFVHSGLTGLVEMVYNPPPTGHVVMVLDNGTTAMTGLQEHPATGRSLDGSAAARLSIEDVSRSIGVERVSVVDPVKDTEGLREELEEALEADTTTVIVARRPCVLAIKKAKKREREREEVPTDAS